MIVRVLLESGGSSVKPAVRHVTVVGTPAPRAGQ